MTDPKALVQIALKLEPIDCVPSFACFSDRDPYLHDRRLTTARRPFHHGIEHTLSLGHA
jgi:hypothetical protein